MAPLKLLKHHRGPSAVFPPRTSFRNTAFRLESDFSFRVTMHHIGAFQKKRTKDYAASNDVNGGKYF